MTNEAKEGTAGHGIKLPVRVCPMVRHHGSLLPEYIGDADGVKVPLDTIAAALNAYLANEGAWTVGDPISEGDWAGWRPLYRRHSSRTCGLVASDQVERVLASLNAPPSPISEGPVGDELVNQLRAEANAEGTKWADKWANNPTNSHARHGHLAGLLRKAADRIATQPPAIPSLRDEALELQIIEAAHERLMKAADAVRDDVCGILCPSQWETGKRPPHHSKCVELRAALFEAIDGRSYADMRASGGLSPAPVGEQK